MAKKCKRCENIKSNDDFSISRQNKDGYSNLCKACVVLRNMEYWRTEVGRISQIFAVQTSCSRQRNHPKPTYTRSELLAWAYSNGLNTLWESWRNSGYQKELTPSVDRENPNVGYSLKNIRLVTWTENNEKAYEDRKNCIHITKQNRKIKQLSLDGKLIAEYGSISAAARATGIGRVPINSVCRGVKNTHTAGGFKWEYI